MDTEAVYNLQVMYHQLLHLHCVGPANKVAGRLRGRPGPGNRPVGEQVEFVNYDI